jgi:peptidoglycan/xylan/chitin deacetylase (PgdA/CDA1 family)
MDGSQSIPSRLTQAVASYTFDDFPETAYTIAGRMIEEAGARATYFANAEFMSQFVDGISYYTPELLKEIHAKGHEIGCHGGEHVALGMKGPAFARASASRNLAAMRQVLGEDFQMTSFAYPFGDVSPPVKWAMGRRYALCRGVQHGRNGPMVDLAQLRVASLEHRHWDEGRMAATIRDAKGKNQWLIFLSHDISENPTLYGSTPAIVGRSLELLASEGIPILTLKAAGARVVFR